MLAVWSKGLEQVHLEIVMLSMKFDDRPMDGCHFQWQVK